MKIVNGIEYPGNTEFRFKGKDLEIVAGEWPTYFHYGEFIVGHFFFFKYNKYNWLKISFNISLKKIKGKKEQIKNGF